MRKPFFCFLLFFGFLFLLAPGSFGRVDLPPHITPIMADGAAKNAQPQSFPLAQWPYAERLNGCGPEGWLWHLIPNGIRGVYNFENACNKHDICYMAGNEEGKDRAACDNEFRVETDNVCERITGTLASSRKSLCRTAARTYHQKVQQAGGFYFDRDRRLQADYETWLKQWILTVPMHN